MPKYEEKTEKVFYKPSLDEMGFWLICHTPFKVAIGEMSEKKKCWLFDKIYSQESVHGYKTLMDPQKGY